MKKIVSMILILVCLSFLSACEKKTAIVFEETADNENTVYRGEGIEIKISQRIDEGSLLFDNLSKLLSTLQEIHPIKKLRIVVSDKVSKPNYDYELKTHPDSIYKADFVKEVIARSYGLYDNWVTEGLYGVVLSRLDKDSPYYDEEAAEVYGGTYFPKFLKGEQFSLFGARFFEELSGTEEVKYTKQASRSLVDYLMKQGLTETLLKGELELRDILAWAEKNQINLGYYNTIYESTKGLRVSKPDLGYLQIESRRDTNGFTINIVSEGPDYDSAYNIETMIQSFEKGIEENLAVIKVEAPKFFDDYKTALTQVPRINYQIDKVAPTNYRDRNGITLRNLSAHIVEYNHLLFDESFKKSNVAVDRAQWLIEGLDAYMGIVLMQRQDGILENVTRDSLTSLTEEDRQKYGSGAIELMELQEELVRANFTEEELSDVGLLLQNEENRIKLHHIFNAAYFNYSDLIPESIADVNSIIAHNSFTPSKDDTIDTVDRARGQNFFTNQSFTAFLIEEYGLEKLLYLGLEDKTKMTYKEYFGKSYDELVKDWKAYVTELIQSGDRIFKSSH